jgi:uncharacterized membrane protein
MQSLYKFIRTTILGGLLVLLPIAGCGYVVWAIAGIIQRVIHPVMDLLPVEHSWKILFEEIIAVLIVLAACFVLGLLVRTRGGQTLGHWMEENVFNRFPIYRLLKGLSHQVAGQSEEMLGTPVVVRIEDSRRIGFLVEEHTSGDLTVYIPEAPALATGSVHVVSPEQVTRLNVPLAKVAHCMTRYGVGTSRLIAQDASQENSSLKS